MSHFVLTVCLSDKAVNGGTRIQEALDEALAPFDESKVVDPYRDYEEGSAEDYWFVDAARRGAKHHADGTGLRPYDPNRIGWSNTGPTQTPVDVQKAEFADDARIAALLGDHPTWSLVAELYNEKYHPNTALAIPGHVDDDDGIDYERLHVDEDGRAYTWTRYNPLSKWDWWSIGGRWQRSLLTVDGADLFIIGQPGSFGDNGAAHISSTGGIYCDGAPLRLLDLEGMRSEAASRELPKFDKWMQLVGMHGAPESWANLRSLVEVGDITIDEARERYHGQAVIKAAQEADLSYIFGPSVEEKYGTTREEFEARARAAAVPGYALLTTTGEWVAPGHMGMFGMSSDGPGEAEAFKVQANQYIDALPDSTWLIQIDCHI